VSGPFFISYHMQSFTEFPELKVFLSLCATYFCVPYLLRVCISLWLVISRVKSY